MNTRSTAGISSPGRRIPTTIVSLEVSIPRWIRSTDGVTLAITVGSFPPCGIRCCTQTSTVQHRTIHDSSQLATDGNPGAGRFMLTPELGLSEVFNVDHAVLSW